MGTVVPVKLDVEVKPNDKILARYKVQGLPTILFLSPQGKELGRIVGFVEAPKFIAEFNKYVKPKKKA